jgi:hypothetical protein
MESDMGARVELQRTVLTPTDYVGFSRGKNKQAMTDEKTQLFCLVRKKCIYRVEISTNSSLHGLCYKVFNSCELNRTAVYGYCADYISVCSDTLSYS